MEYAFNFKNTALTKTDELTTSHDLGKGSDFQELL
jgi:hypothetical protein